MERDPSVHTERLPNYFIIRIIGCQLTDAQRVQGSLSGEVDGINTVLNSVSHATQAQDTQARLASSLSCTKQIIYQLDKS